jgi:hypothetical protein
MDQIEFPSEAEWCRRREWFEALFEVETRGGAYIMGEHALGLLVELQALFCVGAYISVIIVACTTVDAHLRETELPADFSGGMKAAFSGSGSESELEWLRGRRNRLIYFEPSRPPPVTVDDHWSKRAEHEKDAERAIRVVADTLFEYPWV